MANSSSNEGGVLLHENFASSEDAIVVLADDTWSPSDDQSPTEGAVWLYFVWIGLLVCLGLWCVCSFRSCSSQRQLMSKEEAKDLPETERRKRLNEIFERNGARMKVSKDAILEPENCEENKEDKSNLNNVSEDEEMGATRSLLLLARKENQPASGDETNNERCAYSVPNCCAICLEAYKAGEYVVWSCSSGSCPHVYHQNCMVDYLLSYRGDGSPCPSCRRDYIAEEI